MATDRQLSLSGELYRAVQAQFETFMPREQQRSMMNRSLALMTRQSVGIIEAPTGTGKTLGYLIPGVVTAATEDRTLVVSTATASLQDQLASKDVPVIQKAARSIGLGEVPCVILKGRERYVCPLKLESVGAEIDMFDAGDSEQTGALLDYWRGGQWNGERDSLPMERRPHPTIWMKVANTGPTCEGRSCPAFEVCPFYRAQMSAKNARIIVTNHDYLLSILSSPTDHVLKNGLRNIYVFDEGHHLAHKLVTAYARRFNLQHSFDDDVRSVMSLAPMERARIDLCAEIMRGCWAVCRESALGIIGDASQHRFSMGEAPRTFLNALGDLSSAIGRMMDALESAAASMSSSSGGGRNAVKMLADSRIKQLRADLEGANECIAEFTSADCMARWITRSRYGLDLHCSPFDGAAKARKHLWPVVKTAVITSATIASMGNFASALRELGLPQNAPTLALTSPFDYSRASLKVPGLCVEATDKAHAQMCKTLVARELEEASPVGTLVYFTSRQLMQECYDFLPPDIRADVLSQADIAPWQLIAEHKKRVDSGRRSIIFGLDSIGEGVDLPGNYCTKVIITRLPFPQVDDPVLATHAEFMEREGKHPFAMLMLPRASVKLAQVMGRLIRREGDHGSILVLDKRLSSRKYGRQLVKGSPYARCAFA